MLIRKVEVATSGPKYFPAELNDEDDGDVEEEEKEHVNKTENSSMCTDNKHRDIAITKIKHGVGEATQQNKQNAKFDVNKLTDSKRRTPHQSQQPQPQPRLLQQLRQYTRHTTTIDCDNEAIRDAAAADIAMEEDWHEFTSNNYTTTKLCTPHCSCTTICNMHNGSSKSDSGGQLRQWPSKIDSTLMFSYCDIREGWHEPLSPDGLNCMLRDQMESVPIPLVTTVDKSPSGANGGIRNACLPGC